MAEVLLDNAAAVYAESAVEKRVCRPAVELIGDRLSESVVHETRKGELPLRALKEARVQPSVRSRSRRRRFSSL